MNTNEPETTTTPDEVTTDPAQELEALRAKYERAQADIKKFRTRADEVEAAKKAAETDALKQKSLEDQVKAYEQKLAEAEAKAEQAELRRIEAARIATLTGRVADPRAALKLLDTTHVTEDGDVNITALLEAYPFLAPPTEGKHATRPAGVSTPKSLTAEDFRGKDPDWIMENLARLNKA